jgi:hypothetical protein
MVCPRCLVISALVYYCKGIRFDTNHRHLSENTKKKVTYASIMTSRLKMAVESTQK